ncbi:MAG: CoA ester lyase [Gammaproteobacteria bacterium]|nr:CoA ester lyase [Gammaproteobacteria bacterium]
MNRFESSPVPFRLQRSELAVPGSNPGMIEKAAGSEADCVLLDCEDSVAPDQKSQARCNIISALNEIDWKETGKTVSVRINGTESPQIERDVGEIIEKAGYHIDTILIPKVNTPEDVHAVERLLSLALLTSGITIRIGLECLIETALGLVNVEAIARLSCATESRLEALHFGMADFSASCQSRSLTIGEMDSGQTNHIWHPSRQRILVACRAYGLRAVDGPYGDFRNPQGFIDAATGAAAMGYDGKWAIHPDQVMLANQVMSPTDAEVEQARKILDALDQARSLGQGVVSLDEKMVDAASGKMAENIISKSLAIAEKPSA